ncbi:MULTISPECIES: OsmC family peroxiredoxin [Brevibacterium]|uniref:OsmC family peroxiredoxin n=1 Tax=Brevibacterium pityocampae TaxID=506594 RepID=A0ABP8JEB3_9MICO|nr:MULTISPECIES: OsmC family peroxiredoxin [Actinomycetes]MCK1802509.1 OsmC family peroxiredoxin [Brevibacterium sp. R8603A2]MCX0277923.1 OsmC family peroxiredoxin [Nocardia zapadnayensis]QCP05849.1 OsmC family peroxiredoxin [Brevibacterium sp. CS2]
MAPAANAIVSKAHTTWHGTLAEGTGTVSLDSSAAASMTLSWAGRAETAINGVTNPEELIGAAHSACYSMALSNALAQNGTPPEEITTGADVSFSPEKGITDIHLVVVGRVPGMSAADFDTIAQKAKKDCPVSKALKGVDIHLTASLG